MYREIGGDSDVLPSHFGLETTAGILDSELSCLSPVDRIKRVAQSVSGRLTHTTSFGLEGQALVHLITESGVDVDIVTIDTGRLFPETYDVWAATEARYGVKIRPYYPDNRALEALVADYEINGFRNSVRARKACCAMRKSDPLGRALVGSAVWFTGLRADQSAYRATARFAAYELRYQLIKVNPLLDWTRDQVADFVATQGVPVNALHARGFLSIGCAPCTRPIRRGEAERAGRWWWEKNGSQECGLHVTTDGRLVRKRAL